jgi:hypothetical protein
LIPIERCATASAKEETTSSTKKSTYLGVDKHPIDDVYIRVNEII